MQDKIFLDSNIILYTLTDEVKKKEIAIDLLIEEPTISIQVINEVSNILIKKHNLNISEIKENIKFINEFVIVTLISLNTIYKAYEIKEKYKYSYYDSLIIASAIENNCNVLYSEDMQHNQMINDTLKIINPFVED